jgi:hypothetical protein
MAASPGPSDGTALLLDFLMMILDDDDDPFIIRKSRRSAVPSEGPGLAAILAHAE